MSKFAYLNPPDLIRNFLLNLRFHGSLKQRRLILMSAKTRLSLGENAQIVLKDGAKLNFGYIPHSLSGFETSRLILEENSKLTIGSGNCTVQQGCTV